MAKSIHHLESIFSMNSRLFMNALAGVTEEQAKERISDHNNPLNWLAVHTTWARFNTCIFLGKPPASNPYHGMFENFKPFDPTIEYPTLASAKEEWAKATELLKEALATVTEEQLALEAAFKSPIGDFTNGGTIAFMAQHESYDIGQMGLLKKYLTKEGMKY
jgi:hypothetical protein